MKKVVFSLLVVSCFANSSFAANTEKPCLGVRHAVISYPPSVDEKIAYARELMIKGDVVAAARQFREAEETTNPFLSELLKDMSARAARMTAVLTKLRSSIEFIDD